MVRSLSRFSGPLATRSGPIETSPPYITTVIVSAARVSPV
jgi:hypothetical protein